MATSIQNTVIAATVTLTTSVPVKATALTGKLYGHGISPAIISGAFNYPTIVPPSVVGVLDAEDFLFDFYYRIWILPAQLKLTNPRLNSNYPFQIWNAYPYPNTLTAITETSAVGVTVDIAPGAVLYALDLLTVNLQIGSAAPLTLDALFNFQFTQGSGLFELIANRAIIIDTAPENPVQETWSWLTNIIVSDDGTEQRINLLDLPRRSFQQTVNYDTDADVRNQLQLMYSQYANPVLLPLFAYQTRIKQAAGPGATTLYANTTRSELRVGGFVYVQGPSGSQIVKVDDVEVDHVVIDAPLSFPIDLKTIIVPIATVLNDNNATFSRPPPNGSGSIQMSAQETIPMVPFLRPTNTQTLTELNGIPILERRPTGTNFQDAVDTGDIITDYDTGLLDIRVGWNYSRIQIAREYTVQRMLNPADFDYWKLFADYCKGMQNPFFMPSDREDFIIVTPPTPGGATVVIDGTVYSDVYANVSSFRQFVINCENGPYYAGVVSVTVDENGNDSIVLDTTMPNGLGEVDSISFLLKCRLAADIWTWTHDVSFSTLDLTFRTCD